MSNIRPPAPQPCKSCPYRRNVPSGVWHADEYAKLATYDGPTYAQPMGLFQCHQTGENSPKAQLCAGWMAVHGDQLLAVRIAIASGRLPESVLDYTTDVELFESGAQARDHGLREIGCPSEAAVELADQIVRRREDLIR